MGHSMHGHSSSKQTGSSIAQQAAQDAKKASDNQLPAAVAAARQVKLQLAEKAAAAAWAAEAALAGKQQVVEQLQAEVREAQTVLQDESSSVVTSQVWFANKQLPCLSNIFNSQASLRAAVTTANQANVLLQQLHQATKIAQETVSSAEAAASGAQQELDEKNKLVDAARNRADMLIQQLRAAKLDYVNTKKAAYRAACAASEARQKALRDRRSSGEEMEAMAMKASGQQQLQQRLPRQVEAPLQEVKQKQPEQWEYNEQGKAIFSS